MPDQRTWLIGAVVALAALGIAIVAVFAVAVWILTGSEETPEAPPVDVLASIALAEGGATAKVPACVLVDRGGLAPTTPQGAECAPEAAPAFALASDAPASLVVGWSPRPTELSLLTRVPPDADPGLARFAWAEGADAGSIWLVDDGGSDVLLAPKARPVKAGGPAEPGWRDAVKAARDRAPKAQVLLLVRTGWTAQDLVRRCDALVALGATCRLGEADEAVLARLSDEEVSADLNVKVVRNEPKGPETLKGTLKANQSQATYCYESRKRANPSLAGRVEIAWKLRAGKVASARVVSDTTGDPTLAECIVEKSKRWAFPLDLDEATAPFVFKP